MKNWLLIIAMLISLGLYAQDNDDLEANLDETLTEMQAEGDILEPDVEKPAQNQNSQNDPSIGNAEEGLFDRLMSKMRAKFTEQLKMNPLRHMSAREVEEIIKDRTRGNIIGDYLSQSPRAMYFTVNFMRDEFAIPELMGVFKKEKEMKTYSYFVLGNLIFFFFLSWYYDRRSNAGFIRTVLRKIFLALLSTAISCAVFYVLFHKELKPTIGIAKEAIFKELPPKV